MDVATHMSTDSNLRKWAWIHEYLHTDEWAWLPYVNTVIFMAHERSRATL